MSAPIFGTGGAGSRRRAADVLVDRGASGASQEYVATLIADRYCLAQLDIDIQLEPLRLAPLRRGLFFVAFLTTRDPFSAACSARRLNLAAISINSSFIAASVTAAAS